MAKSQTDVLTSLQNAVVSINALLQAFKTVTIASSGTITVLATNNSSI